MINKNTIRIHYIQHVPFEGSGYLATWASENNYPMTSTKMYEDYKFPTNDDFDLLIIMGGPMGTYDEDKYPWLKDEKLFIKNAIENNKTVIGICLGSQILAEILGAKVYPNKEKEIGWLPIIFTDQTSQNLFDQNMKSVPVFQWHGDTFEFPAKEHSSIKMLASSEACPNQAFLYNGRVLGLQFHLEATESSCGDMLKNGVDELTEGKYIQTAQYIKQNMQNIPVCNSMMKSVMDKLAKRS